LDLKKIYSFEILLSKFNNFNDKEPILNEKFEEGPFVLEFGEIKAYK
jgi:hypothetical protein